MDSVPLEMDDIFGEYEGDDDDEGFNPSRLPDLEDELEPMRDIMQAEDNQGEDEDGFTDNAELLAKLKSMKGASKNTTKRTMPKLDATRLTGDRGIAVLPKVFERVPLKGRNHEAQDLKVMMHTLQHWGHRLFPKMTFDEVLERVERLGAKKQVQTCLKKIRLDMPVLQSDMVGEEEDTVHRAGDDADRNNREEDSLRVAEYVNDSHNEISDGELDDLLRDQEETVTNASTPAPSQDSDPPRQSETSDLSAEVRKKIEENKRKAMERRAAKLADSNEKASSSVTKTCVNSSRNMSILENGDVNPCQEIQESSEDVSKSKSCLITEESPLISNLQTENSPLNSVSEDLNESSGLCQVHDLEKPMSPEYGLQGVPDGSDPSEELMTIEQPVEVCSQTKERLEAYIEGQSNKDIETLETYSEAIECSDERKETL